MCIDNIYYSLLVLKTVALQHQVFFYHRVLSKIFDTSSTLLSLKDDNK